MERGNFLDQIEEAKEETRRLKRVAPYLFPEYQNWQAAVKRLEAARDEEMRLREIWKNRGE